MKRFFLFAIFCFVIIWLEQFFFYSYNKIIESIEVNAPALGLKEGFVTLHIKIQDYSWKPGRNTHIEEINVIVDMSPPSISFFSRFHYINQGGTGLIIYFASEKITKTGVIVDGNWFQGFGVQRDYFYRGNKIDSQYHLGVDLAASAKSPVKAANHGRVVFADELGIYGKTILLDHGCGLFTLYGHLNQIGVQADQNVEKGSFIGTTGTTGMAGGDHLHFSVLVSGVFVNPIEWWDAHWVKDNVENKLELVRAEENFLSHR